MNQSMKQLAHKIVREKKNKLVLNLSENTSLVLRQGRVVALRHRFNTLKQSPLPEVQVECVELNGEAIGALQQASSSQCYSSNDDDEYLAYWEVRNPDTLNKVVLYNLAAARKNPSIEFPEYALPLLENKTPTNSRTLIYLDSVQQVFNGGEFSKFEENIRQLSKEEKQECWRSANSRRRDVMSKFSRDENDGTLL